MNYISVCSGIEAASTAWHPLGWNPLAFSEIEKFPSAVLAHHYPKVPNLGDMTKFHEWPDLKPDLIVGGTPCQAFSVAGLRQGLADPRGNLTLTFLGLVDRYRPRWVVWENVPGVLSDRTNAFGQFLAGLGQLGYGWAYRVLDAQYFGVAQRRKRVFVVAHLGDWTRAAEVLFEPSCLRGNPPPSREAGQNAAPTLAARTKGGGGLGTDFDCDGGCIAIQEPGKRTGRSTNDSGCGIGLGDVGDPMFTLQAGAVHGVAHALRAEGFDASEGGTGRGTPIVETQWPAEIAPTLNASFGAKQGLENQHALNGGGYSFQIARCLTAKSQRNDAETENLIPTHQGGFFEEDEITNSRFLCRNCDLKFGVDDYPRNPTCPNCKCMTVDDLLQRDSFPDGTPLAFAEVGSPNNPEPIAFNHNAQASQLPSPNRDTSINDGLTCSQGAAVAYGVQDDTTPKVSEERIGANRANAGGEGACVNRGMSVRRLTPEECEKLQGFEPKWTKIPYRGKPAEKCPDGPRYKALGNSMAVPCMAWIGKRIAAVNAKPQDWTF